MKSSTGLSFLFSLLGGVCLLLCAVACKKDEATSTYSQKYPAFISLSMAEYAELPSALSQGTFVTIRRQTVEGGTKITISNGVSSNSYPLTKADNESFRFGLGGFIIGTNYMGEPLAYDLSCPNCDRTEYRLTVATDGTCRCSHCHIVYDLNNYGFISSTEGNTIHATPRGLYRYHVDLTFSTAHVYN